MSNQNKWTDDLHDRLSQYESKDVPQGLWDDIEHALDGQPKRRPVVMRRWISLAAAAVVAACVVIVLTVGNNDTTSYTADNSVRNVEGKENANQKQDALQENNSLEQLTEPVSVQRQLAQALSSSAKRVADIREEVAQTVDIMPLASRKTENVATDDKAEKNSDQPKGVEKKADQPKRVEEQNSYNNKLLADYVGNTPKVSRRQHDNNMSLSLYASNIMSSSKDGGYGNIHADMPSMSRPAESSSALINTAYDVAMSSRYSTPVAKANHHQPISLGLGARYFLNSHWAVETGLTYTMLESEFESGLDQSYNYTDQKIHYVGVPLSIGFQWINARRLTVYTNAGVKAEFAVDGKLKTHTIVEGKSSEKSSSDLKDIPMQWSVGLGAGVQYNILGNLGVYAEPGMTYYIDNGSSIETSYSDKPLNFSLKVGLRYDFGK